jgi:microcystin degradation protein MlrC
MTDEQVRRPRIAIGSIFQESNHFVTTRTDLALFRNTYVVEGDELFDLVGTDCEIAGMLSVCTDARAEVVPLLAARSVSGGPLTDACYGYLKQALLAPLREAGMVDGILLALHGSMVAESEDDPEGDLLVAVRTIVGDEIPVVVTLDLHANITPRMISHATAIIAYAHYPHDDAVDTGERAARLLVATLRGEVRPVMAMAKVPMLVSGCNGQTFDDGPMGLLTQHARALEREPRILSVSCLHVQPYLDMPGLGCGGLVVTDDDALLAARTARELATAFWHHRFAFLVDVLPIADAVARGRATPGGPILLVDTADCTGGGAAGDSVALLRELLRLGVHEPALLTLVDPIAAEACASTGSGNAITLELGHRGDASWGQPLAVSGVVGAVGDGRFTYTGGIFGGTGASMGPSVVLHIGSIQLLIMSRPTYEWADEQYRALGLDARAAKFVGVKNPMNYRFAYRDIAAASFIVDTPGPTPAHVRDLPYQHIDRPCFPFDEEIPDLAISCVMSRDLPLSSRR